MKDVLTIDIETFSGKDLASCGVYAYAESEDFEILLLAYAFNDEGVQVVDIARGEEIPSRVMEGIFSCEVIKCAFNGNFEMVCLSRHFNKNMIVEQWRCTAVHALRLGLPHSLSEVSKALNISKGKLQEGKELIRLFSMYSKGKRNYPWEHEEKWEHFKEYCKRDVEVEREVRRRLNRIISYKSSWIEREQQLWCLDQRINNRGIRIDREILNNALIFAKDGEVDLNSKVSEINPHINIKSVKQIKDWIREVEGFEVNSLRKENLDELIERVKNPKVKEFLLLRNGANKTSIKKYEAMDRALGEDERIRGLFQFYGASRTGRWAGRLVQVQNLPRGELKDIKTPRELLKMGDYESLDMLYESSSEVLSSLIRSVFIPSSDSRFIICDYSAIEARITAFISREKWRIDVFNTHGKIYEASASHMFKVPMEEITKDSPLRQKGKIAELALGYGGGAGALITMGASKMGLSEEEIKELVKAWRRANPNIVEAWSKMEKAAIRAIRDREVVYLGVNMYFSYENSTLFLTLPSGRKLCYFNARIQRKSGNSYEIRYEDSKGVSTTYGGKLFENMIQSIARDCLSEGMMKLWKKGYEIVMHVHDEVVIDAPLGVGSVEEVVEIMEEEIGWIRGLKLRVEGFEGEYYRK